MCDTVTNVLDRLCADPEALTWGNWLAELKNQGIKLRQVPAFNKDLVIKSDNMRLILNGCKPEFDVEGLLDVLCEENISLPWSEWAALIQDQGITLMVPEEVGLDQDSEISAPRLRERLRSCQPVKTDLVKELDEVAQHLEQTDVDAWREAYAKCINYVPIKEIITTEDGSPIRLNMQFRPGYSPLITTRIYVPTIVCSSAAWFGCREDDFDLDNNPLIPGWNIIIRYGSSAEIMANMDIRRSYLFVRSLHIVKMSYDRQRLMADVYDWE